MVDIQKSNTYRVIRFLLEAGSYLPRRMLAMFAHPLGIIWYIFDRYHRRIAYDNMRRAFRDEFSVSALRRLVKANFIQLSRVMLELPSLLRLNAANVDDYVEFSGAEHLNAALAKGKGVLFLTAHLGNWELMALATPLTFDFPVHVMARPLDHKALDTALTEIRTRTGNSLIDKDKSAGRLRQLLRQNQIIGILLDQNASWYEGVYVPFFGRVACTNKGLAMLAMRYRATVIPAFNIRLNNGRYRIIFHPPVSIRRTGNIARDILENTARFNRIIEDNIRKAPDNWLWVHRRWRLKPIPAAAWKRVNGKEYLARGE